MAGVWPSVPGSHCVQFFEREDFLHRAAATFLAEGARRGGPLVIITSRRRFQIIADRLADGEGGPGIDVSSRVLFVDGEAAVDTLMDGSTFNRVAYERAFAAMLAGADRISAEGPVWFFGDMVDTLCRQGHHHAAIELEVGWNALTAECRPFTTVCAYAIERFDDHADAAPLRAICGQHTHVLPAESFTEAPDDRTRLERVLLLQQRARALSRALGHKPSPVQAFVQATDAPAIYVIDDDASVRRSLARLLASVELPVRTFESAEAFLADVDESSSGCLIVDVQLLGMSGPDLQRRLAGARHRWPIIAMSGAHDAQIEQEALRLGAVAFLHKPFLAESLLEAILRARS